MKRKSFWVSLFMGILFAFFISSVVQTAKAAGDPSTLSFEGTKWFTFGSHADCMAAAAKQRKAKEVAARLAEGKTTSIECTQSFKYVPDAAPPPASPPTPTPTTGAARIFFTDLDSGPATGGLNDKGAFVTLYGKGFGASRGTSTVTFGGSAVDSYVSWSDKKIVVQLGAAAKTGAVVVGTASGASNSVPFTVRPGAIYFVSPSGTGSGSFTAPMSPKAAYAAIAPGVTFYFRGGSYTAQYGQLGWSDFSYVIGASKSGTAGNPVAFVGYPGETASFSGYGTFGLRDSSETVGNYLTIANLTMKCPEQCVGSGANTNAGGEAAKSGGKAVRVVGNVMSATYSHNTQTGILTVGNDGWRIYGNELKDTGTTPPINNNHAIYIQVGSSDVDVGWNYLHNLRMGHVIQVHTDTPFKYENVRIHDNLITAVKRGDSRGINVGEVLPGTYGSIYNNVLSNLGGDFSAVALYGGDWKVHNNTFAGINATAGMLLMNSDLGTPTADVRNNVFVSDGASPYVGFLYGTKQSQVTASGNVYFGKGAGPAFDAAAVNVDPKLGTDFKPTAPAAAGKGAAQ